MKIQGIIPARWTSSRFEGKVLAKLKNKPILQWVYESLEKTQLDEIIIATDDDKIYKAAKEFCDKVYLTKKQCQNGTERVAEVAKMISGLFVMNIQADQLFINPKMIDELIRKVKENSEEADIWTLKKQITLEEAKSKDIVKVVTDKFDFALYFSRSVIPYPYNEKNTKIFKHIGVYVYNKKILPRFLAIRSELEEAEDLEQLRALEWGYKIKVIPTNFDTFEINTPEDLERAKRLLND